jgi:hypothetical protein
MAQQIKLGTRTPQILEYERQAEERAKEAERIQEEREAMLEAEMKMQREEERIAQEEYEMRQYYEAEALKHAEEVRVHQEEVRKHQARVRAHQQRILDHEASSEAFAKVIAMPAKLGRDRQVSFLAMGNRSGSPTTNGNGNANGLMPNGNGIRPAQAPAQFPS